MVWKDRPNAVDPVVVEELTLKIGKALAETEFTLAELSVAFGHAFLTIHELFQRRMEEEERQKVPAVMRPI